VARICQAIKDEFDAWKLGDLSGIELECLFCEGSSFQMRLRPPLLMGTDGRRG
jgi:hypothetical protein